MRDPLRNPIFCNILIAPYKEIQLIFNSKKKWKVVFNIKEFCLLLGIRFEIHFFAIFYLRHIRKFNWFLIRKKNEK